MISYSTSDNVYQPSRCEEVLEEIRQCCIKHSAISVVCDGIDTSKPYEHNTVDYVCINCIIALHITILLLKMFSNLSWFGSVSEESPEIEYSSWVIELSTLNLSFNVWKMLKEKEL